ncbi:MAG TPA: hypothetical protein VMB21_05610 [Candidatus Limnocylindria bacterium]|nr:hypothetical protein [Candidatus Limnocylindria bacterium]
MPRVLPVALIGWLLLTGAVLAERINQEGRILGSLPVVTTPILFNTPEADAVVSAMQIFPATNPWNEDITHRPVLTNSDAMIGQIMADLRSDRRTLIAFQEMNYVLVPDSQPRQDIRFFNYSDQSDLEGGKDPVGRYPIPTNLPIETWPSQTGTQTLAQWQMNDDGSDRHSIMVAPGGGFIWETWLTLLKGTNWMASNGAKFDLNSNALRPAGWTSGDAAGLPMFPALPRFDECERGLIEHACRIVVKRSRYRNQIYPATHYAAPSTNTSVNLPAMGQRVRLKAGFSIPANWTKQEKAILLGLKKYGALVADNGNFFSISVTPDNRWPAGCFSHFTSISITNFEVIQTTGPAEGPRSPGAPAANAGPDQSGAWGQPVSLSGFVSFTGATPAIHWKAYSGPGTVTFGDASKTNTTASFSLPGTYTLMLSAEDGVHAVAYDAVVITVTSTIAVTAVRNGTNLNLSWAGGSPPYAIQQTGTLPAGTWSGVTTTGAHSATLPVTGTSAYFRVTGQ